MTLYLNLLKRFGLRMWGSFIVGTLASVIPYVVIILVATFLLITIGVAGGLAGLSGIDPMTDPEAVFSAIFSPGVIVTALLFFLFYILVSLFVSAFTTAGSFGVVSEAIQEEKASVGAYFRYGFRRLFPMLGLMVVLFLLAIPPILPLVIGVFMLAAGKGWSIALGVMLFVLTFIGYIAYALITMHAPPALIAEKRGVFESIAASFNAFQKRFGQVLLSGLILLGLSIAWSILSLLLKWGISGANPLDPFAAASAGRNFLSTILLFPVGLAMNVILVFTLVFRYLHVIQPAPSGPGGGSGATVAAEATNADGETATGPLPPEEETNNPKTNGLR